MVTNLELAHTVREALEFPAEPYIDDERVTIWQVNHSRTSVIYQKASNRLVVQHRDWRIYVEADQTVSENKGSRTTERTLVEKVINKTLGIVKAPKTPRVKLDKPAHLYTDLPQVLAVLSLDDSGEFGNARCPHCGAEGRYVYWFMCADGSERGAMRGCFEKYPKHKFAQRMMKILDKENELARDNAKYNQDKHIPTWDKQIKDAVFAFGRGEMTEAEAEASIRAADAAKAKWMQSRGYR